MIHNVFHIVAYIDALFRVDQLGLRHIEAIFEHEIDELGLRFIQEHKRFVNGLAMGRATRQLRN